MDKGLSVGQGALWVLAWFGVMLFYTFLDVAVWRKIAPGCARVLNVITIALCMGGFLGLLRAKLHFQADIVRGTSVRGILWAVVCAAALVCGVVLGLLYLRTGSLLCCITAHAGYNLISYFTMILPIFRKA